MSQVRTLAVKRATLEGQLTSFFNALEQKTIDKTNASLRLERLKELFFAYEEMQEELAIADSNDEGLNAIKDIRDRYYELATHVATMPGDTLHGLANGTQPISSSTFIEKQRLLKLPVAELPKFDGQFDRWITFKNAFTTMVNARMDIEDLVKFFYLQNALQGEALNKISIFDATAENYKNAWKILVDAYDRKRILVAKHLDALIEVKPLNIPNAQELSKLVDDTRRHLNVLNSLGVKLDDMMVVRLLARALPISIRQKWEESLDLDALPKLDEFYKFINATTFRLSTMASAITRVQGDIGNKRSGDRNLGPPRKVKFQSPARAMSTNVIVAKCSRCNQSHRVYSCLDYTGSSIEERWKFVQSKGLCVNCLGVHSGVCKSGSCKKCGAQHHTSLHREVKVGKSNS